MKPKVEDCPPRKLSSRIVLASISAIGAIVAGAVMAWRMRNGNVQHWIGPRERSERITTD